MKTLIVLFFICLTVNVAYPQTKIPSQISGGVVNGKAISLPKPVYPIEAKNEFASGKVNVQVTIDEQGNVISAKAVSGHPLLLKTCEEAAFKAKFSPTKLSGNPVKVVGVVVYNFVPTEIETPFWVLSMFLTFVSNADSKLITEIKSAMDVNQILDESADELPIELAEQKPLFIKFKKSNFEERKQISKEIILSLKNQLKDHQLWQIELGENFGLIVTEVFKFSLNGKGSEHIIDESNLKTGIQNIKRLCDSPPNEISKDFVEKFKPLGVFANEVELTPKINLIYQKMNIIFETIEIN